jgi:hypothetical protein
MKRKALIIFGTALLFSALFSGAAGYAIGKNEVIATLAHHVKITNDGRLIDTGEDVPLIYKNKTYLPVRAVGESLGYEVKWFSESNTVNLSLPEEAYPLIAVDGIEIVNVSPSLNLMSATAIQMVTVIIEQSKSFPEKPILTLEILKNGVVIDSQTTELRQSPGKYTVNIRSSQFAHQLRNMSDEERLAKYNEMFSYRLKIH